MRHQQIAHDKCKHSYLKISNRITYKQACIQYAFNMTFSLQTITKKEKEIKDHPKKDSL